MHRKSMDYVACDLESLCQRMVRMDSRVLNDFVMQVAVSMGLSLNNEVANTFLPRYVE
jgi:hypothetical protein